MLTATKKRLVNYSVVQRFSIDMIILVVTDHRRRCYRFDWCISRLGDLFHSFDLANDQ
jgi:hypothetical protein